jgi:hypothetical protein
MMRNYGLLMIAMICGVSMYAQKTDTGFTNDPSKTTVNTRTAGTKEQYYALHPKEDRSLAIEITGLPGMSFSVTNTADGSAAGMGYNHSENIVISLQTNVKDTSYQLVFYSEKENFQKIMSEEGNTRSVFYPMSMYADIKQKLEQSISLKKKVQLKLTLRKEGYSEAKLLF